MREAKKTLRRVILLIWVLAAVVMAAGGVIRLFYPLQMLPYFLGLILGSGISTLLMLHRFSSLDIELDMNEKGAEGHLRFMATLRLLICLAALFAGFYFRQWFNPVTVFAGLFATKAAALLYPLFFREPSGQPMEGVMQEEGN